MSANLKNMKKLGAVVSLQDTAQKSAPSSLRVQYQYINGSAHERTHSHTSTFRLLQRGRQFALAPSDDCHIVARDDGVNGYPRQCAEAGFHDIKY